MITARPGRRGVAATALAVALLLVTGCGGAGRPSIAVGIDSCAQCSMVIDEGRQAAGYLDEGRFVTFDSPLCLLRSYDALRKRGSAPPPASIFLADYRDGSLHPAEAVSFLLTTRVPTVMQSGVLCFADRAAAEALRESEDELLTDWLGYRSARGEPDRIFRLSFGPGGMEPELVQAARGEITQWEASAAGLERNLAITITGYPELAPVTVPATGERVVFRLLASRPGDGFPVVDAGNDGPLGRLRVSGAHTADEEAR